MINARSYQVDETLRNGKRVVIRAIRPDDKELILDGFKEMDQNSIYLRFFQNRNEITDREMKYFTEVDFTDHVALVVTADINASVKVIGGGRYFAYDHPAKIRSAEVAFMVHDQYQGQGIATLIMKHLLLIARDSGIAQFEAEILSQNEKMLAVFSRTGLPMSRSQLDGVLHVTMALEI